MNELITKIEQIEKDLLNQNKSKPKSLEYWENITKQISKKVPEYLQLGLLSDTIKEFPLIIPFADNKSIAIELNGKNNFFVSQFMQIIALQIINCLPKDFAQFHFIDTQNFGADFAAVANLDKKLIGNGIIDDENEIRKIIDEQKNLARQIIQKYLGYQYNSLNDYNLANEHPEPFRFVFISNFPHGFRKEEIRDLLKLVNNSNKIGLYLIFSYDKNVQITYNNEEVSSLVNNSIYIYSDENYEYKIKNLENENILNTFQFKLFGIHTKQELDFEIQKVNSIYQQALIEDNETDGISIPIGKVGNQTFYFEFGFNTTTKSTPHHGIIGGSTGSGKSNTLNSIIANGINTYSPDELRFALLDCKGIEFQEYKKYMPQHIQAFCSAIDNMDKWINVLDFIDKEIHRRAALFNAVDVSDIIKFKNKTKKPLPRIIWIIDEYQNLLTYAFEKVDYSDKVRKAGIDRQKQLIETLIKKVFTQGRAFGIHLFVCTQKLGVESGVSSGITNENLICIALKMTEQQSERFLNSKNHAPAMLQVGEAIYNAQQGRVEGNVKVRIDDMRNSVSNIIDNAKIKWTNYEPYEQMIY